MGGIGILAVMLIAVRERTREIGLRRALGARRLDIRAQFVTEAVLLSGAGGAGGVLLGVLAAVLGSALGSWPLVVSWPATLGALLGSVTLGVAVGTLPALRAARLEPVAALRA